jgi:hypothetical protein
MDTGRKVFPHDFDESLVDSDFMLNSDCPDKGTTNDVPQGGIVTIKGPSSQDNLAGVRLVPDDPWKHRSEVMQCRSCMYYVDKPRACPQKIDVPYLGRCRRHAPTMKGYPAVFENDWCGDHKLDENKI